MPALIMRAAAGTSRRIRGLVADGLGLSLVEIAFLFDGVVFGGPSDIVYRLDGRVVL